jgi:hypothetical protein
LAILSKDKSPSLGASARPGVIIGVTVACTLAVIAVLTLIATAGIDYLPDLYRGGVTEQTLFANYINIFMWLWGATALVVVFMRRRVVLDLWLAVTLDAEFSRCGHCHVRPIFHGLVHGSYLCSDRQLHGARRATHGNHDALFAPCQHRDTVAA